MQRERETTTSEVNCATEPVISNGNDNYDEGRTMLHVVLELLGEYRVDFQGLKEAIKEQNEIISNQQDIIRDLKEAAVEQQNTTRALSQQLEDTKKQMGDELKRVRAELGQSGWRCRAVTKDRKNPNRIRIACRDEAEQQMMKRLVGAKLTRGARILRDELYPIKVDNVNRIGVLDEEGGIRTGAAEVFGKENDTQIAKIVWLSKRDIPKAYGSMAVYLTKASDAKRLLAEGFFYAGGESGYTGVFERRPRPNQCYKCQQIGHKAFQCSNTQICGKCARGGHHHSICNETIFKCVLCEGPHRGP
ncbi:hypothetical protein HIM_11823 [Hirsutella minnesotensis 3608]|uniref:CCHC-type domain-containing protein n=1 Tax=Hirsutella minnesotensis 3608 TaxID=1043627 RepID=A0A0F8A0R3_9HYPO|nr:hypothetical protein HIM_11823 [Hirsutella minnesotensis 3608]